MVVLAAAVCTKAGKALISRQFVDISRVRLEGLLAAFPKLMGSGKQHTFIETESVRYVYQPLENLYMLLLTNKSSNILEDLETLHLLAKIVPEYCRVLDEEEVASKAFELVFAFDEVIAVGYREKVTLQQINTFMEMDSHEEKIHEMNERIKEIEAKKEAEARMVNLEKIRAQERKNQAQYARSVSSPAWSSNSSMGGGDIPAEPQVQAVKERKPAPASTAPSTSSTMKLVKKGNTPKFLQDMAKEEGLNLSSHESHGAGASEMSNEPQESVNVEIVEVINVTLESDGGLKAFEVKGDLNLTINEPEYSRIFIRLNQGDNRRFNFKPHPNINKSRFDKERVIALMPNKAFPTGNPLGILKWRFVADDENLVPLAVTCWPTPAGDGSTIVTMQYELKNESLVLGDVRITIPIIGSAPVVGDVTGNYEFDVKKHVLIWKLDLIEESNSTGSMEFTINNADKSAFFPITVSFISRDTFCDLNVEEILDHEENQVQFSQVKELRPNDYNIV